MPETPAEAHARLLYGAAVYAHIKDYWKQTGREMTADNEKSFANVEALRQQHGVTDAEIAAYRRTYKAELDRLAAIQA
ncbi:hypothetical protein AB0F20_05675 [Streptomyces goshikiensis]|uniref:hypothetical protein n=1 Tax=Streptomyces goshikiensis TaxID=1942 RepID=UPI0033D01874